MGLQYAGGTNVNATSTLGNNKWEIMKFIMDNLTTAGWSRTTGNVGTVTITIASPGVVSFASHGLIANERVMLRTTGALPTGLVAGTVYFVKAVDANSFKLAATSGGADINTSGSQSGVHTLNAESVVMQTATTSQSLALAVRIKDNAGNCATCSIESTDGLRVGTNNTTNGMHLLPEAAASWRILANKFQFFIIGPNSTTVARKFGGAGVPYIPSPNTAPANVGWLVSNSFTDSSSTVPNCWRTSLEHSKNGCPNIQMLWGTNIWENANAVVNTDNFSTLLNLVMVACAALRGMGGTLTSGNPTFYRWASDDIISSDALLSWGLSVLGDEPKIRAQLWDALIIHESITGDTTTTFDSHSWFVITNSNVGTLGQVSRGCLVHVIP